MTGFITTDPDWRAVMAMMGKSFEDLTVPGKIAAFNAVNRRRSLEPHETDLLCELIEQQRTKAKDARYASRIRSGGLVRRFTAEEDAIIIKMWRNGSAKNAIAAALGRNRTSVRARIKRLAAIGNEAEAA